MGSPLGPTFANFYMGHLENTVFNDITNKPAIYARYVDDIFIQVEDDRQLFQLQQLFQQNSVLKFTHELSINNKLPFLDVNVETVNNSFKTTVYRKPTNIGTCLNANSECPEQYKISVISNFIHRIYKITQNWTDFHTELQYTKQMLINNNYSNSMVDSQICKFLDHVHSTNPSDTVQDSIDLYYKNQMHKNYKIDERTLTDIIHNNVNCIKPNTKVKLHIYYKNRKASSLVMRNNSSPPTPPLSQTGLVYEFKCPFPHGQVETYIGLTQQTLTQRLSQHYYSGSIFEHFNTHHRTRPTKPQLQDNTIILSKAPDRYRLSILEALLISQKQPSINRQFETFTHTLKLFINSRPSATPLQTSLITDPTNSLPQSSIVSDPHPVPTLNLDNTFSNFEHEPPDIINNTIVSPSIQSRINRLIQNSRNDNQPSLTQPFSPRRLRSRQLSLSQP